LWVTLKYFHFEEIIQKREYDTVEDFFYLRVMKVVEDDVRAQQDALQVTDGIVSDFPRSTRRLAGKRHQQW
jgi:hypothetical protein